MPSQAYRSEQPLPPKASGRPESGCRPHRSGVRSEAWQQRLLKPEPRVDTECHVTEPCDRTRPRGEPRRHERTSAAVYAGKYCRGGFCLLQGGALAAHGQPMEEGVLATVSVSLSPRDNALEHRDAELGLHVRRPLRCCGRAVSTAAHVWLSLPCPTQQALELHRSAAPKAEPAFYTVCEHCMRPGRRRQTRGPRGRRGIVPEPHAAVLVGEQPASTLIGLKLVNADDQTQCAQRGRFDTLQRRIESGSVCAMQEMRLAVMQAHGEDCPLRLGCKPQPDKFLHERHRVVAPALGVRCKLKEGRAPKRGAADDNAVVGHSGSQARSHSPCCVRVCAEHHSLPPVACMAGQNLVSRRRVSSWQAVTRVSGTLA